ncbi:MAG TPA: SRPBCC family protein [Acidimicrobiales bacterium]|nr:SRPBCC family protein [Acidimicrobiales bacterium]
MPTTPPSDDRAEIDIAAPPEEVWDLVADVTRMGEWSPECYRCEWLDGGTGPRVGGSFKGWNRQGPLRWATTSTVLESERGEVFSFVTKESAAQWAFHLSPTSGGGTHLVETRTDGDKPLLARIFFRIVPGRADRQRDGMQATLGRLKAAAEA